MLQRLVILKVYTEYTVYVLPRLCYIIYQRSKVGMFGAGPGRIDHSDEEFGIYMSR